MIRRNPTTHAEKARPRQPSPSATRGSSNGEECNFGARISSGEQAELNKSADLLTSTIGARAAAHGFGFVDPRSAFTGHAICDSVEWVNGLSNPILESYHPNRDGQNGYTQLLASKLGVNVNAA